ncbi:MAG: class I SAM-dependent methyltransferase [Fimbriimonadaceae bacterium]|nr:class I SAM-dependent methyltransferase [Fimbriimonadaceae bacterium]
MYDQLASIYDRFIDWPTRLARELPRLQAWLGAPPCRVADLACGTGQHAAALAAAGYDVVGFDPSAGALAVARAQFGQVTWHEAAFGHCAVVGEAPFDAAICLGNSWPHLLTPAALRAAVADLGRLLRPGGRALLAMRHLARSRRDRERWLPLRTVTDPDGTEWVFQRHYDHLPAARIDFHFVTLCRPAGGSWSQRVETTRLRAWTVAELGAAFEGWQLELASNLDGAPFDPATASDLVLRLQRGQE